MLKLGQKMVKDRAHRRRVYYYGFFPNGEWISSGGECIEGNEKGEVYIEVMDEPPFHYIDESAVAERIGLVVLKTRCCKEFDE